MLASSLCLVVRVIRVVDSGRDSESGHQEHAFTLRLSGPSSFEIASLVSRTRSWGVFCLGLNILKFIGDMHWRGDKRG